MFRYHNLKKLKASTYKVRGYLVVVYPKHPRAWKKSHYVYYHRLVMENHLGRYLHPWELVHHKDEDLENNLVSNLRVITKKNHGKLHALKTGKRIRKKISCPNCNKIFYQSKTSQSFCNRHCANKTLVRPRKVLHPNTKKLKKLVWRYPRTILAKKFGVSDVAISNWCKRLGIDMPGRGYWAKIRS